MCETSFYMCVSHRLDTESHVLHSTPHGLPQSKCDKTGKKTSGDKHQTNCYVIIPLVKSNNTASCYISYYLNSCLGYIYTIVNVLSFICPCLHSRVTHFSPCFTSVLFSSPVVINVMIHPVTKTLRCRKHDYDQNFHSLFTGRSLIFTKVTDNTVYLQLIFIDSMYKNHR